MTYREFYTAVEKNEINDEVMKFAANEIAKLDATNEKRRATQAVKAAEKEAERAPIRDAIVKVISNEPKTATMLIAEAGVELKPQAIPSLLKGLVADGVIAKAEVKVTGKGKQVGYVLA